MKSHHDLRTESFSSKARYMEGACSRILLKAKMAELYKAKEDLKQAKDDAIESWLDSRHLIDELVKLQASVEIAKNRSIMPNTIVTELESQLQTTITSIESEREEELNARKMINQINDALDETREEIERIKMETDEQRRERSKLKQVLRMRRQTLHALQLNYRALRLELEVFGASASEALQHINRSQKDNTTVQLTLEDYNALTRAADEETFLNDWRVSVTTEQRLSAQESRDLALKRFKKLYYSENESEENKTEDEITREQEEEEEEVSEMANAPAKLLDDACQRSPPQLMHVSESSDGKQKSVREKKPSVFAQLKKIVAQIT